MAGTKRQKVTIGERAKGVVQAKNVSRRGEGSKARKGNALRTLPLEVDKL